MFWLCLRFPHLALEVLRVDAGTRDVRPLAIVDGPLQRRHVVIADAAAHSSGVRCGQAATAARMLCPRLVLAPRDPRAECQALESLAGWAYRFSSEVSLGAPDAIFLEAGRSLALFGGWPALQRRLRGELGAFGFVHSIAAAPTPAAARVLATQADGLAIAAPANLVPALGAVPLDASGLDARTVAALRGMGFRRLRDLFRLPRAELARRIGEEAIAHLDRMRGLVAEILPRWHPPDRFERRIEFAFAVESHTALAFPLQRLIREFALFLVMRDAGTQRFTLVLGHERGASTRVEIGLLAPQRDAGSLFELARARLERIELPAPAHALALHADDLPPLQPQHRDLFDANRREVLDWPALAERLRARLGDLALRGLACAADHRPDHAWRFAAAGGNALAPATDASTSRAPAQTMTTRPFWLLRRPIVLRDAPLRILAGPERIESGWWDEHDQRRDYYIVETRRGQRAWAFVEAGAIGVPAARTTAGWMLHGWFA